MIRPAVLRAGWLAFAVVALPFQLDGAAVPSAVITEFVADNKDGLIDSDGEASDWIEIWNSSGEAGDLGGYYLTDDPLNLTKWQLPAAGFNQAGYAVIFASGKDRTDPAADLHTNFKVDAAAGAYLALVKPDGITLASEFLAYPQQYEDVAYGSGFGDPLPVTLVAAGDSAKWHVPSGPVADWTDVDFDDASWDAGATGIGYDGSGDYLSLFGVGGDVITAMRNVNPSIYIRIPFQVDDPGGITGLKVRMKWEDGFHVHLNGTQVVSQNAPAGAGWDAEANNERIPETQVYSFDEFAIGGALQAGTNVLAIQGLNSNKGSSDFLIVPELVALQQDLPNPQNGYFLTPTPGALNGTRREGLVGDTQFSSDRGFYQAAFDLAITTVTEDAEIRYTLDGSPPDESTGLIYSGPIPITGTTVVRAMAHRAGFEPTNIDTHTYLFPADVIQQPKMRAAITQSAIYGPQMVDSLQAVPTISLVTENLAFENEFGSNIRDEHQTSIEMIFPDGTPGFQEDGGLSNYGGRFTNFRKKSFRVAFRSEFGTTKLSYPIFAGFDYKHFPPAQEFDVINLRSGSHDMQSRGAYMSNRFTDDSMLDMGNIAPHGRFVHLYLNGKYWGQYHLRERWSADMASSYFGGPEADYDAVNANDNFINDLEVYDGTGQFWNEMNGLVAGADPFNNAGGHIDIANIIDFMLLWVSGDSESEFRSFGSDAQGVPFKFMIKDADGFLRNPPQSKASHAGPLSVMSRMRSGAGGPDFSILLADRIHKHFFNDGALTPAENIERLQKRVDEARLGFISEGARWGDLFREPASWESYQANLYNNHFPNLTATMIGRFKAAGMYPDIIAPVLSQHGGTVAPGGGVTMATNATAVYYTFDGSDPRLPGGAVSPTAILAPFAGDVPTPQDFISSGYEWKYLDDGSDQGTAWRSSDFEDDSWEAGPSELGYGDGQATLVGFIDTSVGGLLDRNATTYFRTEVDLANPGAFSYFILKLKYDDGAAVYVNGVEILRTANLPAGAAFDTYATDRSPDENAFFEFEIPSSSFVDGSNTLAVEIHNDNPGSSDISFDMVLRGEVDISNGNNVTVPVEIEQHSTLRARAYNSGTGEWSALNEAFFSLASVPADSSNIRISELHYHPHEPTAAGEIALSTDRDDYEFVEFHNPGINPADLSAVYFTDAITFAFAENTILDPDQRIVIVRNLAAFTERYGADPNIRIGGVYSGRLSNDGERVALFSDTTGELLEFTYNDQPPWPTLADTSGHSLVLTGNSPAAAAEWGAHSQMGGAPGYPDSVVTSGYLAWKNTHGISNDLGDKDGDGLHNMIEFGFGTNPLVAEGTGRPRASVTEIGEDQFLTISYQKNLGAAVDIMIDSSTDLENWSGDDSLILVSETPNPGGETATVVKRTAAPISPGADAYLRVVVTLLP